MGVLKRTAGIWSVGEEIIWFADEDAAEELDMIQAEDAGFAIEDFVGSCARNACFDEIGVGSFYSAGLEYGSEIEIKHCVFFDKDNKIVLFGVLCFRF